MESKNIEIQNAKQTINLLKKYKSAKTQEEKDKLLQQMDKIDGFANRLLVKYTSEELITNITKAISLDKYRPKNLPITLFAVNKDLDNIGGEFDTFDRELSQMVKKNENPDKIRDRFREATANIYILAKQFTTDWIRRLNNHKELVRAARNAPKDKVIDAYNELFDALTKDFCDEYGCVIDAKLVENWETSDIKPEKLTINGFTQYYFTFSISKDLSKSEYKKKYKEIVNNLQDHPESCKRSNVRINFSGLAKKTESKDLFYVIISVFAHEMHHALDFQNPRQGALGPQIQRIDDKTYVSCEISKQEYHKSATEISSYEIEKELKNRLIKSRF